MTSYRRGDFTFVPTDHGNSWTVFCGWCDFAWTLFATYNIKITLYTLTMLMKSLVGRERDLWLLSPANFDQLQTTAVGKGVALVY